MGLVSIPGLWLAHEKYDKKQGSYVVAGKKEGRVTHCNQGHIVDIRILQSLSPKI
jgi:hypothetical protein